MSNNLDNLDENELRKKLEGRLDILKFLAELTGDNNVIYYSKQSELIDLFHKIGMNRYTINDEQFKQLANMMEQFEKMVLDFLDENNIKLKEIDDIKNGG